MRCKKHPSDLSSTVGVCSSCLRERLIALIAAQAQAHHQAQLAQAHARAAAAAALDDRRKSDTHIPPPLIFPRSVSPYVRRRKSDDTSWSHRNHHYHHRFYSTPQVGPTYSTTSGSFDPPARSHKKKLGGLSLFSSLFRSRSEKLHSDSDPAQVPSHDTCEPSSSSSSWLSTIFTGSRKKQSKLFSVEDSHGLRGRRRSRMTDRGMSPVRVADSDEEGDRSPSASGYSSESSQGWRKTPKTAPSAVRRGRSGQGRNVAGMAFCLSPLVRASPNRQWNQKGGLPPDIGYSGDVRVPVKPHLSAAASFCANRSRKLVDFGRVNHNR